MNHVEKIVDPKKLISFKTIKENQSDQIGNYKSEKNNLRIIYKNIIHKKCKYSGRIFQGDYECEICRGDGWCLDSKKSKTIETK